MDIINSALKGDLDAVKRCVEGGQDINARDGVSNLCYIIYTIRYVCPVNTAYTICLPCVSVLVISLISLCFTYRVDGQLLCWLAGRVTSLWHDICMSRERISIYRIWLVYDMSALCLSVGDISYFVVFHI